MTDRRTVLAVALGLVLIALAGVAGITLLAFTDHQAPEVLGNVTVGALGALAALLASTRSGPASDVVPPP